LRVTPYFANIGKRLIKTPKIYLYDSGLACFLLGIRDPEQLRRHPLRGALFETWVVNEVLKARLHNRRRGGVNFFRDQKGHEVDLIVDKGTSTAAVEIKAGQTVASDLFKNLEWLAGLEKLPFQRELETVLVYGGAHAQRRSQSKIVPWSQILEYDWIGPSPDS